MDETRWHRHWYITVRKQGRVYRFLRKPRRFSTDKAKVEKSIFAWGYFSSQPQPLYTLSILGILHGLTGLTLYWEPEPEDNS